MRVIIDHREKGSLVAAELANLGAEIEFKHLILADYIISKDIAVERKTVSDFITSMIDKRILLQLRDLKSNFSKPLLLIEGVDEMKDLYHPHSSPGMNENSIRGMILSVATDFGIPILFTKDAHDTAVYLFHLAKREEKGKKEFSFKVKRKAFSPKEQQEMIVEGFPGIGPGIAKSILSHFKTIRAFAIATTKQLEDVPKLGKKKAAMIVSLLDRRY